MVREALDTKRNPFCQQADHQLFLAERGGRAVGRIAAIENPAHNQFRGDFIGFFGFLELVNDQDTADALVDAASRWLGERGRVLALGIRAKYRTWGILPLFLHEAARRAQAVDAIEAEASWILDDNEAIRAVMEAMGGDVLRRWRLYQKPIAVA